jgi:putative ABC transport system ATP-binding protein
MPPLVRATDLVKVHGPAGASAPVLRKVSLAVEPGEFACVMGPSGSGKTTLLHLLSGLDQPTSGTVELAGRDLARVSDGERTLLRRRTVGHVFQFFHLLPDLSVLENVGLPLSIEGHRPEQRANDLRELLARVGLAGKEAALPHQLSGGELQRTSIARALAGGQPLLLCDEPTGNLSQKAGLEVMELLREVNRRDGRAVLLVTHNPRDATFAERVLFLVDGTLDGERALRGPGIKVEDVHAALSALHI